MSSGPTFAFDRQAIDTLFPMHVAVDAHGSVQTAGKSMARVLAGNVVGKDFRDVFTILKPRSRARLKNLSEAVNEKLVVSARASDGHPVELRCFAISLNDGSGWVLADFSFGANLPAAIERFQLAGRDFKPNDMSIDLFYTLETQRTLLEDAETMARALSQAKEDAEQRANVDVVTGIANRRALNAYLERLIADGRGEVAFLHIDLDKFKIVNDTFGHAAGDLVLEHTAKMLSSVCGPGDLPARIGGDEFALILRDPPDDASLSSFAQGLIDGISKPIRYGDNICQVTASIGVMRFGPGEIRSADRLFSISDIALYDAKSAGNTVTFLTPAMVRKHDDLTHLIGEIEAAIESRQFVPHFQPQVDVESGQILGLEVLARWRHPTRGVLAPSAFLDIARKANLLGQIDRWIMRMAMRHLATWKRSGLYSGRLAFNITAANLRSPEFAEEVQDAVLQAGLVPGDFQLELLESILFEQSDRFLVDQCQTLQRAGFSLALDDFGTGHASIATLIDAPVSLLKIDRSFVAGIDRNPRLKLIADAMLGLGRKVGLQVLAEGVETEAEYQALAEIGYRNFQGYFFGRPCDAEGIVDWIHRWSSDALSPRISAGS